MDTTQLIVLGIDPGIHNCGWSIHQVTITLKPEISFKDTVLTYGVFDATAIAKQADKANSKLYGSVFSLFLFEKEIDKIIRTYRPNYVASEGSFFNPRMPNAYISLSLCINAIQRVLFKYSQKLYVIPPKLAKQTLGNACADKDKVKEAIHKIKNLKVLHDDKHKLEDMVEHESDSVGIGYTFISVILPTLLTPTKK